MNLVEQYRPFINENGLISYSGRVSQNDARTTSEAIAATESKPGPKYASDKLLIRLSLMRRGGGVLYRAPDNDEQDSWDNYIPWLYTMRGTEGAERVFKHGYYRFWIYKNKGHGKFGSSWMGRYPIFRWHARSARPRVSGRLSRIRNFIRFSALVHPFDYLLWVIGLVHCSYCSRDSNDGWVLWWFSVRLCKDQNWLSRRLTQLFVKQMKIWWPNGIGQILHDYITRESWYDVHPNAENLWCVYE